MFGWFELRKLPHSNVALDDDGIWPMSAGKRDGLIEWTEITQVKERTSKQRLELLDHSGHILLKVDFTLAEFEHLRELLIEKVSSDNTRTEPRAKTTTESSRLSENSSYHRDQLIGALFFGAFLIYFVLTDAALLMCIIVFALIVLFLYQYMVSPTAINIRANHFEIDYPFTKRSVRFSDITDIIIRDIFSNKGRRTTEVCIVSKNAKKPFGLGKIGDDSIMLLHTLSKAANL